MNDRTKVTNDYDWMKTPEWKAIRKISYDNCINFTGQIERGLPLKPSNSTLPVGGEKVMTFGKYKSKAVSWVKQHDLSYYNWCCKEIKGFKPL